MKKARVALFGLAVATAGMLSFNTLQQVGIKGKVTPPESVKQVWAISATDTLKTTVKEGAFQFENVKEGVYRLVIEAKEPYKHTAKDSVVVKGTETTDVGEITLTQ